MGLRIGIEHDLLLRDQSNSVPSPDVGVGKIQTFAERLVSFHKEEKRGDAPLRSDFSYDSYPGHYDSHISSQQWTVTTDDTVGYPTGKTRNLQGWPLEFVSPIFDFSKDSAWREKVKSHWIPILEFGNACTDNTCATHVHISPETWKGWSLEQLKHVAQAVLYFEEAFEVILAPSRRGHGSTKRNKANNYKLKERDFQQCCKDIEDCGNTDRLVSLIQPCSDDPGHDDAPPERNYVWNFENAKSGGIGTIEFRGAPGVLRAEHCLIWVELAVSFVQAAAQHGTQAFLEKKPEPTVEGLKEFILSAITKMNDRGLLEIAFYGHFGSKTPIVGPPPSQQGVDIDKEMSDIFTERLKLLQG